MEKFSDNEANFKWLLEYFGSQILESMLKENLARLQAEYDMWNNEASRTELTVGDRTELERLNERIKMYRQDYEYSLKMIEKLKGSHDVPIQ